MPGCVNDIVAQKNDGAPFEVLFDVTNDFQDLIEIGGNSEGLTKRGQCRQVPVECLRNVLLLMSSGGQ